MQPVLEIGDSVVNGKIRLYNDRLEFQLRTRHAVVPIDQISGVTTGGFGFRDLKLFTKTGDLIEAEFTSKRDYEKLSEAIRRIQAGETLEPGQLERERVGQVVEATKDFAQDKDVKSCGLIVGAAFVLMVILSLIISAVGWIIDTIGSLF